MRRPVEPSTSEASHRTDRLAMLVQVMEAGRELVHDRVQRGEDVVSM